VVSLEENCAGKPNKLDTQFYTKFNSDFERIQIEDYRFPQDAAALRNIEGFH